MDLSFLVFGVRQGYPLKAAALQAVAHQDYAPQAAHTLTSSSRSFTNHSSNGPAVSPSYRLVAIGSHHPAQGRIARADCLLQMSLDLLVQLKR